MARWVSVKEAAELLGISQDTVKRRLKSKAIPSRREATLGGYRWLVEIESDEPAGGGRQHATADAAPLPEQSTVAVLERMVESLERNQAHLWEVMEQRGREISELHVLLQRSQETKAPVYLPAQRTSTGDGTASQVLRIVQGSWWWKRLFAS